MAFDLNSLDTITKLIGNLRKLNPHDVRAVLTKGSQACLDAAASLSHISKTLDDVRGLLDKIVPDAQK